MSIIHTTTDPVSVLHGIYAFWHVGHLPGLGAKLPADGFALTAHPFAAATSLTLALAAPTTPIRVGHSILSLPLCLPHLQEEVGARWHFLAHLGYLGYEWILCNNRWGREESVAAAVVEEKDPPPQSSGWTAGRILAGFLGTSQLGISILFSKSYATGDPAKYEPFLTETLHQTDTIPLELLTPKFLRGVYLAGTYSVLGIGWSLAVNLGKALYENDLPKIRKTLESMALNLSVQVVTHSIFYLTNVGGNDFSQYMFVHGPMSAPALALYLLAIYLNRTKPQVKQDETKSQ